MLQRPRKGYCSYHRALAHDLFHCWVARARIWQGPSEVPILQKVKGCPYPEIFKLCSEYLEILNSSVTTNDISEGGWTTYISKKEKMRMQQEGLERAGLPIMEEALCTTPKNLQISPSRK
ncbi:hypothetical protein AMTR_s00051p00088290 [Amborella trichopoda]|uniref:Uncharacterized protein n=1 Tax=Amborella trichopoda TaxID=13333 RepID=U5CTP1_AMBTC|nr:hypothetical protein AMTR_s00051p00088290 [Amborella trichopoda]